MATVIDNFFDPVQLDAAITEIAGIQTWNDPNKGFVERQTGEHQKGDYERHENYAATYNPTHCRWVAAREELGPHIKHVIESMSQGKYLQAICDATGISDLFLDKNMRGGGVQRSGNGAYLAMHLDNNWNPHLDCHPAVNTILFLSEWDSQYGGELELWDGENAREKVAPLKNRLVIRRNDDKSFHGFPTPIQCPDNVFRDVLVLFYYSKSIVPDKKRISALWI